MSALTDFGITVGTALTAAMVATGATTMPSSPVIVLAIIGGAVQGLRTVQQALKATPETAAALKGSASIVVTRTEEKTP